MKCQILFSRVCVCGGGGGGGGGGGVGGWAGVGEQENPSLHSL